MTILATDEVFGTMDDLMRERRASQEAAFDIQTAQVDLVDAQARHTKACTETVRLTHKLDRLIHPLEQTA